MWWVRDGLDFCFRHTFVRFLKIVIVVLRVHPFDFFYVLFVKCLFFISQFSVFSVALLLSMANGSLTSALGCGCAHMIVFALSGPLIRTLFRSLFSRNAGRMGCICLGIVNKVLIVKVFLIMVVGFNKGRGRPRG